MQSHHLEMTHLIPCHCWGLVFFFFFFFLLLLKVREFEADWFTQPNFSLIEVQQESTSFCHLTHCYSKCLYWQPLIFCMFCGAIGTGDNIWLSVWLTGSWHIWVQDTKTLNLLNNTPPSRLSPSSLLWLHFQSFLCNLMPCKVDPCNECSTEWLLHNLIETAVWEARLFFGLSCRSIFLINWLPSSQSV